MTERAHSLPRIGGLIQSKPLFHPAYRAWIGAGRRRRTLWRLGPGVLMILAAWVATSFGAMALGGWVASMSYPEQGLDVIDLLGSLTAIPPAIACLIILASFLGLWIGVWAALRLLHRRSLVSTLSAPGRWRWRDFLVGTAIALGLVSVSIAGVLISGQELPVSEIGLLDWGWLFIPLIPLTFLQACGEEVMMRGYLQQQLSARCRNPLVWAVLPSLLFGLLHLQAGWQGWAYVGVTTLFGLAAALTVWRTGSLAGAMGLHFGNNFLSFALAGPVVMRDSLLVEGWLQENATPGPFLIDALCYLAVLLWVMSRWSPFRPNPRAG